jgi:hypothetical protein
MSRETHRIDNLLLIRAQKNGGHQVPSKEQKCSPFSEGPRGHMGCQQEFCVTNPRMSSAGRMARLFAVPDHWAGSRRFTHPHEESAGISLYGLDREVAAIGQLLDLAGLDERGEFHAGILAVIVLTVGSGPVPAVALAANLPSRRRRCESAASSAPRRPDAASMVTK